MAWTIEYADSALKQLKKLDKAIARQILDYMDEKIAVLDDPTTAGKPMSGTLARFWRYRISDHRAICFVDNGSISVLVLRVSHRKKAYDDEKQIAAKASEEVDQFRARKKAEAQSDNG